MLVDVIARYGYPFIFVAAAVEGDATLLTATFLAHRGYLRLDLVMLVAAAATVSINQVYFSLGRRLGHQRAPVMRRQRVSQRLLEWLDRHRTPLVIGSRFIYGFRIAIPAACGATGMSRLRFTLQDVAGSIIWAGTLGLAGYAVGHVLELLVADLRAHEWWVALALFLGAVTVLSGLGRESLIHFRPLRTAAAQQAEPPTEAPTVPTPVPDEPEEGEGPVPPGGRSRQTP